jgi:uncharacterized protein (UPF0335 family)
MNIDKKALKGIVDEIEASRARQKGETEFQREVMKRAKQHQLDTKAIRIVLQRRAMGAQKRDEQDYYVHAYELALGGKKDAIEALERGASIRDAAAIGGISTGAAGNLAKTVQKSSFVDNETGEIRDALNLAPDSAPERDMSSASPSKAIGEVTSTCGDSVVLNRLESSDSPSEAISEACSDLAISGKPASATGPQDLSDDDPGPIPHFLRRPKQEASV